MTQTVEDSKLLAENFKPKSKVRSMIPIRRISSADDNECYLQLPRQKAVSFKNQMILESIEESPGSRAAQRIEHSKDLNF